MANEECDFDELAALLDESDEEPEKHELLDVKADVQAAESSDDDIDDEELDRLAGLIETEKGEADVAGETDDGEQSAATEQPIGIKTEPELDEDEAAILEAFVQDEGEEQAEQEAAEASNNEATEASSSDNTATEVAAAAAAQDESEESDDDNADVQAQISQMYEMIKQLENKVKKKPKKIKGEGTEENEVDKTENAKTATENGPSQSAVKKEKKEKHHYGAKSAPTVKLSEEDIFSQSTDDDPTRRKNFREAYARSKIDRIIKNSEEKREGNGEEETEVKQERFTLKQAQESLFGSDSDSDWEGLDGERPDNLNPSGQEIKQIMKKSEEKRVAHTANYDVSVLANRKPKWGKKDAYKPRPSTSESSTSSRSPPRSRPYSQVKDAEEDKGVVREEFSGLRIINPRISSTEMKFRMEGRILIPISDVHRRIKTSATEQDWVTIGVLVAKSEPKMSSKGNQYSIWTLSDLKDCNKIVKMFLFGEVHKQHWKTSIGSVTGFLNPNPMSNNDKYQNKSDETTLCIDNGNKIMHMGQSRDFGYCKSFTKAGNKCINFVNRSKSEHCDYHVAQEYKKRSAQRGDLQAGFSAPIPKCQQPNPKRNLMGNGKDIVFYEGKSYSTSNNQKKKKGVTMSKLHQHEAHKGPLHKGKVSTLSLFELRPEDAKKLRKYEEQKNNQDNKAFCDLLAAPSSGSMNLVKYLMKSEKKKVDEQKQVTFRSITAQDLLKEVRASGPGKRTLSSVPGKSSTVSLGQPVKPVKPGLPQLGRGFVPGDDILLESPTKKISSAKSEMLKRRAIDKIKQRGGIKKENPNAVKKSLDVEKIKRRISVDQDSKEGAQGSEEQPRKRPRLLGDIDLNDPDIQKLLKKKSKHDNLLRDEEMEKQEEYFDALEKKEKLEQKLLEITSLKMKVVTCKQCNYTDLKPLDKCREERHTLVNHEAKRRFFKCQHCQDRAHAFDRLPNRSCKCGKNGWVKTSMMKEKKGPKLENEELLLRGEECKFLNSLQA